MPSYSYAQPTFKPAMRFISAISRTNPMVVTTDIDNSYLSGLTIHLIVPREYGMSPANNIRAEITVVAANQFTMPVDATLFPSFVMPAGIPPVQAQAIPFAENALQLNQAMFNVLPY